MIQFHLPKGPTQNKLTQTQLFNKQPIKLLEDCRKTYGKTFSLNILGHACSVIISDPADLKQVFTATTELNTGEIGTTIIKPIAGDYSLLCLDGKKHMAHRKLLLPPFRADRMQVYGELMAKMAKKKIVQWKSGQVFPLLNESRDITFSVILSAIFGMNEENSYYEKLEKSLHALTDEITKPFSFMMLMVPFLHRNLGPLTPWARMMKLRDAVNACVYEEIESRKKMDLSERTDILSLLLQARDEEGNSMTDQEIHDEMITLLIAGHETSSVGIAWAIYGILANSQVLEKIKEELSENYLDKNSSEQQLVSCLDKLVYLDAVVKEALRITPVVATIGRVTTEDGYKLGEYILPKGTIIVPAIYLAHRDPDNWVNPDKFMPERFLNSKETPYTYLPFGGGIRRCIGAAFAQYEMKTIIAQILLHTELALKNSYLAKFERKGLVIVPSDGMPVIKN